MSMLQKRVININLISKIYDMEEETTIHVIRDCDVARKILFDIGTPIGIIFHRVPL